MSDLIRVVVSRYAGKNERHREQIFFPLTGHRAYYGEVHDHKSCIEKGDVSIQTILPNTMPHLVAFKVWVEEDDDDPEKFTVDTGELPIIAWLLERHPTQHGETIVFRSPITCDDGDADPSAILDLNTNRVYSTHEVGIARKEDYIEYVKLQRIDEIKRRREEEE